MYRLLCTGTLEESIFQRQIFKGALYDLIDDSNDPSLPPPGGSGGTPRRSMDDRGGGDRPGGPKGRRPSGGGRGGGRGSSPAEGGAADSRGFSQEELKQLFVLKKTTKSDTYDKLKRRRATTTMTAAVATATMSASPRGSSSRRYQDTPFIRCDGSTSSGDGGSFAAGPAPTTTSSDSGLEMEDAEAAADPAVSVERWKAYEGPSDISDKALRWALEGSCTATGDDGGAGNASAAAAGSVVTFVREVLRGGGAAPPPQPREISTGRDPIAAKKGSERLDDENVEGVEGENTPPA